MAYFLKIDLIQYNRTVFEACFGNIVDNFEDLSLHCLEYSKYDQRVYFGISWILVNGLWKKCMSVQMIDTTHILRRGQQI